MTAEPVGPLTPEAEAVLRADVAALEERGRHYAGRYDILSLLATLDAERIAVVTLQPAAPAEGLDVERLVAAIHNWHNPSAREFGSVCRTGNCRAEAAAIAREYDRE